MCSSCCVHRLNRSVDTHARPCRRVIRIRAANEGGETNLVLLPAVKARERTGLSQSQSATLLGLSVSTLQGWEQGRKQPSGAAPTFLTIARMNSKALLAVAGK